jgi:aminopeptidase N
LASKLSALFIEVYQANSADEEFSVSAEAVAKRSLKNLCLAYLSRTAEDAHLDLCDKQFASASNMTDQHAALRFLVHSSSAAQTVKSNALDSFYNQWSHEPLVVDQWFSIQAANPLPGTLEKVNKLMEHGDFNIKNPNKVRSLIGAFCGQNHINFHNKDGSGYAFLADRIIQLDSLNPQIASRLLAPLTRWKKYDPARQKMMIDQLGRIRAKDDLSKDVFEVVEKSLADA